MRALAYCRIGVSAIAAEAPRFLLSQEFIRTISCHGVALVLICISGFIDYAAAQEKKADPKTHEEIIKKMLERPQDLVIYPPPIEPPKEIPKLPCPPDEKSLWLLKFWLKEWQQDYQSFENGQKKAEQLQKKITELQAELQAAIDQKQTLSQISKIELSLSNALYQLDRLQKGLPSLRDHINNVDSQRYNELLEKLLKKKCDAPQPQTAPQPPPANPPPAKPPSGGRYQQRMLPESQWLTGVYGGVGAGVLASFCPDWTTTAIFSFGASDPLKPGNQACYSTGFLITPYVGYQWSFASRWLAGVEGDFGYATNNANTGVPGVSSAPGDSVSVKEDWNGSVRGRLGYAVAPNIVVYGTAGLALQHVSATVTCSSATPFPCGRFGAVAAMTATNAPVLVGGTVGVGAEFALTDSLRLRAEYRYSNYGTYSATYGNPANVAVSSAIQLQTNTALLGLTYAFGPTK